MLGKNKGGEFEHLRELLDWDLERKMKIPREQQEDEWYGDLDSSVDLCQGLPYDDKCSFGEFRLFLIDNGDDQVDDPEYVFAAPAPYAGDNEENWALPGILVTVHKLGEDSSPVGVVQEVHPDGFCSVALKSNKNEEMLIACHNEIKIVPPKMSDKVKVIGGDCRGVSGELNDAEGSVGWVLVDDSPNVAVMVALNFIAKSAHV